MPWSTAFKTALQAGQSAAWVYELSRINLSFTDNPGSSTVVSSETDNLQSWLASAPIISGAGVDVQSWLPQVSTCTLLIGVYSPSDFMTLAQKLPRGTAVQVTARDTISGAGPERIFLGSVEMIDRVGSQCRVTIRDMLSALRTRISTTNGALFSELIDSSAQTLGANYTAGDTTITLSASVGSVFRLNPTFTKGAVRIDGASASFYVTFTGVSGSQLTGVSSTAIMGTSNSGGALSGATIAPCVYFEGHPFDAVRRILTSTGTSANGAWDDYHSSWGLGISDSLLDHADITLARQVVTPYPAPSAPSSYSIVHAVDTRQTDVFGWLSGFLAQFGAWLTCRQGMLTLRATTDPRGASIQSPTTGVASLNLNDVESVGRGEVHGATIAVRYPDRVLNYDNPTPRTIGFGLQTVQTMPQVALAQGVAVDRTQYTDDAAVADDIGFRVLRWEAFPPHTYELTGVLAWGAWCPGDWVYLSLEVLATDVLPDLSTASSTDKQAMVLAMGADWSTGRGSVTLGITSAQ